MRNTVIWLCKFWLSTSALWNCNCLIDLCLSLCNGIHSMFFHCMIVVEILMFFLLKKFLDFKNFKKWSFEKQSFQINSYKEVWWIILKVIMMCNIFQAFGAKAIQMMIILNIASYAIKFSVLPTGVRSNRVPYYNNNNNNNKSRKLVWNLI